MKRGQVTVFIILGITILFFSVILIILNKTYSVPEITSFDDLSSVKDYVEKCLKEETKQGVTTLARHGGSLSKKTENQFQVTYWQLIKPLLPTLNHSQTELSKIIIPNFQLCLDNFSYFLKSGMEIEQLSEPQITTKISNDKILTNLKYSLKINYAGKMTELSEFQITTSSNYGKLHNIAREFVSSNLNTGIFFCMSCISRVSAKHKIPIHYEQYGEDFIVNIIEWDTFSFAIGYNESPQVLSPVEYYYDLPDMAELPIDLQNIFDEIIEAQQE